MIVAINYANERFRKSQILNTKTALKNGVDKVIEYSDKDIDAKFYLDNKEILDCERGNGYWLWKPYFINKTLEMISDGDYLIYTDSGSYYIEDVSYLIDEMENEKVEIMLFSNGKKYMESTWSKRDAFILMKCDEPMYAFTAQFMAGFIVIKKTSFACAFFGEWLKYATDARIITDKENTQGEDNYPGFEENRHDQTVLSLLAKKNHLKAFRDPSQKKLKEQRDEEYYGNYPQIFELHKLPDISSPEELEKRCRQQIENIMSLCQQNKKIVIYGAGQKAKKITEFLHNKELEVSAYIISDEQAKEFEMLNGIPIYFFSMNPYSNQECNIISTIGAPEVIKQLEEGCYTYIWVNNNTMRFL